MPEMLEKTEESSDERLYYVLYQGSPPFYTVNQFREAKADKKFKNFAKKSASKQKLSYIMFYIRGKNIISVLNRENYREKVN